MNNFLKFNSYDGGVVRVGNISLCPIKVKGYITLDRKNNTKDVYFVDGLKLNLLSVQHIVDKGCVFKFT